MSANKYFNTRGNGGGGNTSVSPAAAGGEGRRGKEEDRKAIKEFPHEGIYRVNHVI